MAFLRKSGKIWGYVGEIDPDTRKYEIYRGK
jgi:hypothetical protein